MADARGGKDRLAAALTRVVAREGIAGVSVRAVATEAGVSGGTVQHYFPTRAEMIRYTMEQTSVHVERRLAGVPHWGEVHVWTREILLELLPLDATRHREHAVWLAFVAHAATDPHLADLNRQTNVKLRDMYVRIIRARRRIPAPVENAAESVHDRGIDADAALLHSVLDGLSLQLAALNPQQAADVGPALLDRYLAVAVDQTVQPGSVSGAGLP